MAEAGERPPFHGQDHTSRVVVGPSSHLLHEIIVCEPSSTLEVTGFSLPLLLQLANQKGTYTARHLSNGKRS